MKKIKVFALAGLSILALAGAAYAQQYHKQEGTSALGKTEHAIFAGSNNGYIVVSHPEDEKGDISVAAFDSTLQQLYMSKLQELSNKYYVASIYTNGILSLFCTDGNGHVARYTVDGRTGTLTGPPAALFSFEAKEDAEFYKGCSADSSHYYLFSRHRVKRSSSSSFNGVIMDRQMNTINKFSFTTPDNGETVVEAQGTLFNSGELYIVYSNPQKTHKNNYVPFGYAVVQVGKGSRPQAVPLGGLPKGDIRNISWHEKNNQLLFTGFLSRSRREGFTAIVSGAYDPLRKKITGIKETALKRWLEGRESSPYYAALAEKGLSSELSRDTCFVFPDSSRAIIYSTRNSYIYQSYYGAINTPMPGNHSSYSMPVVNRGDVCILKLDADNEPQWLKVVRKEQEELDLNLHIGSCYAADDQGGIHVFFYDIPANASAEPTEKIVKVSALTVTRNKLACVSISSDGKMKKSFLYDADETRFHLSPERSVSVRNNQLAFIGIRHRLAFSMRRLLNKAGYHLGIITIKRE